MRWPPARPDRVLLPGHHQLRRLARTTTHWLEHWLGKQYGPAISTAQTPDQVGANRPSVATPVRGLYLAGDGAGGRGIGTELAADSAMECAEHILTDLGRSIPTAWGTDRYRQPPLSRLLGNAIRPTPVTPRAKARTHLAVKPCGNPCVGDQKPSVS